jgi:anti-sigma regulatory factor (Ser/Thr protein kinase)
MKEYRSIALNEAGQIGQARRAVHNCAKEIGLGQRQIAELDICIEEIGSNAIKFARGTGHLYFSRMDSAGPDGIEIIYFDKGPGIESVELAMEDGYSTSGGMGTGLGAIKRMSDEFYIYSKVESHSSRPPLYGHTTHGTAFVIRKYLPGSNHSPLQSRAIWGVFIRSLAGQSVCGDAYLIKQIGTRTIAAVIDGLGHGASAKEAAQAAAHVIEGPCTRIG